VKVNPLAGITIIDFSFRLPGPFGGKILSDLGATVIKIEDHKYKDPFLSDDFSSFDPSFVAWYEELNSDKKLLRFNFDSEDDQQKILEIVNTSDAMIMGLPQSLRKKLKLTEQELNLNRSFVIIELHASKEEKKSLHDLNALALSGLLSLYIESQRGPNKKIINPPFLPIAGIMFGHKAATDLLANLISAKINHQTIVSKIYLDEVTNELLGIFWTKKDRKEQRTSFLHNGHYPCYSIYQTKDLHYIALAAVEEKFWTIFCEVFKIKTSLDRFYNQDQQLFEIVSEAVSSLTLAEIEAKTTNLNLCLTPIL
jgi:crotonobetainyl-CoA:carnitine CoA-transferase CaiB-like acyl-CoA transferase